MKTEKQIRDLYQLVLSELETPVDDIEKYLKWEITTPTERMLKKERLDMMKALFEWVLESEDSDE